MEEKLTATEGFDFNGFKLIKLKLINDKLFGSIEYDFIDRNDTQNEIYTTVIIGQNGTFKSRLFSKIISLFWSLQELKNGESVSFSEEFILIYSLNHSIYEFSNLATKDQSNRKSKSLSFKFKIDKIEQQNFEKLDFPLAIISLATMLTDRYPFPDPKKFQRYRYLGFRYRPQLASTKTFIGRVVEFVSNNINSDAFLAGVKKLTKEFLPQSHEPWISFYTQNTPRFFKGNMSVESFYSYFQEMDEKYKKKKTKPPFKLGHYKSIIKNDATLAEEIVNYCNSLKQSGDLQDFRKSSSKAISFNLLNEKDINEIRGKFILLDHMRKLGIIYPPEIEFLHSNTQNASTNITGYSIVESSSGEHNLFGSMVGIIASIQINSLIFIDEPEISLHPNWQMKYLSFLRELLSNENYSTCHIIVATHSHFLISDLRGNNSKIIGLKRENSEIKIIDTPKEVDTFGWTAEEVLYRIFKIRTTRNHFFEYDVQQLASMIERKSIDKPAIQGLISKLEDYKFSENDPLKYLIKMAKELI